MIKIVLVVFALLNKHQVLCAPVSESTPPVEGTTPGETIISEKEQSTAGVTPVSEEKQQRANVLKPVGDVVGQIGSSMKDAVNTTGKNILTLSKGLSDSFSSNLKLVTGKVNSFGKKLTKGFVSLFTSN